MQQDFSYGIIPLMQQDNERYTIMIKLSSGNHRGIPKWHPNNGESILQTALREFSEETGLSITTEQVDISILYEEQYEFFNYKKKGMVSKSVWYYIAKIPYTDITTLSGYSEGDGEIIDKKIISLSEAIDLATYDATREVLQKVYTTLKNIT